MRAANLPQDRHFVGHSFSLDVGCTERVGTREVNLKWVSLAKARPRTGNEMIECGIRDTASCVRGMIMAWTRDWSMTIPGLTGLR